MNFIPLRKLLITNIKNGYSPNCTDEPTGKWVLGLGSLDGNGLNLKAIKPVPINNHYIDHYILRNGDFLVSRSNTWDKVGRSALFRGEIQNCAYPDLMMRFRIDEKKVLPDFLDEYLRSDIARKHFMRCAAGTSGSMVKITKSVVENLNVILPSLSEQKTIAKIAKVAVKLIKNTESLIYSKERKFEWLKNRLIDSNFKEYKSHLFKYAGILKKQRIDQIRALKPLTVKLHCKGIKPNERDIQIVLSKQGRPYFQRFSGEFLIGRQNFHNGGFGIVPDSLNGFIASNAITSLEINETKLNKKYLFYYLSRINYYRRIGHIMDGTGQKELSDKQIMQLPVSIPSLKEQKKVVYILDTAQKEIELLKRLAKQYSKQKSGLIRKLLTGEWRVAT